MHVVFSQKVVLDWHVFVPLFIYYYMETLEEYQCTMVADQRNSVFLSFD